MDVDNDKSEDKKMGGYERYMRLHAIVQEINSNPVHRTIEWYIEHDKLLRVYRKAFPKFTNLNPEIENVELKIKQQQLDILIDRLIAEYSSHKWFSLYDYLQFNKILIEVVDYIFKVQDDMKDVDVLDDLFSALEV